ncbi:MAG: membrane dipeptidase, partial [Planctomycetota bacterium]
PPPPTPPPVIKLFPHTTLFLSPEALGSPEAPLTLGVLVECADPIESPEQLEPWLDLGVVAVGLSWWHGGRYAAGNGVEPGSKGDGLTDLGRALVERLDEAGVVHDLSHLSQLATEQLLEASDAPVVATHSNARSLLPGSSARDAQRHLDDATIREIARRGGVIGINLYSRFLSPELWDRARPGRASIDDVCAHADHIAEVAGERSFVGLGSDADGGFGADRLPEGIDRPRDYERVAEALRDRGWSDEEVAGFRGGNWRRFWSGD